MNSRVLHITGMTCNSCASHVENALLTVPGVHQVEVSYPEALARVSGEPALDPTMLFSAVEAAGYGAMLEKAPPGSKEGAVGQGAGLAGRWRQARQRRQPPAHRGDR